MSSELDEPFRAMGRGNSAVAIARFGELDDALASRPDAVTLQARACVLAISQALTRHAAYFDPAPSEVVSASQGDQTLSAPSMSAHGT